MSEPYVLPSHGCCWAGHIAYPDPCPWHPPDAEDERCYVAVGVSRDPIDPDPPVPSRIVPSLDEPIDKYVAENEQAMKCWRRRVRERRR